MGRIHLASDVTSLLQIIGNTIPAKHNSTLQKQKIPLVKSFCIFHEFNSSFSFFWPFFITIMQDEYKFQRSTRTSPSQTRRVFFCCTLSQIVSTNFTERPIAIDWLAFGHRTNTTRGLCIHYIRAGTQGGGKGRRQKSRRAFLCLLPLECDVLSGFNCFLTNCNGFDNGMNSSVIHFQDDFLHFKSTHVLNEANATEHKKQVS